MKAAIPLPANMGPLADRGMRTTRLTQVAALYNPNSGRVGFEDAHYASGDTVQSFVKVSRMEQVFLETVESRDARLDPLAFSDVLAHTK